MGMPFSEIIIFYVVIFSYLIGWILETDMDFKISGSMKTFQHLLLAFINKKRTVPRVYASVRNNERKLFTGLTWLSAIKLACNFCIKLVVVGNQYLELLIK